VYWKKYLSDFQCIVFFVWEKVSKLLERKDKVSTFAPLREGGHGTPGMGAGIKKKYFLFFEKLPYLCQPERVNTEKIIRPFLWFRYIGQSATRRR